MIYLKRVYGFIVSGHLRIEKGPCEILAQSCKGSFLSLRGTLVIFLPKDKLMNVMSYPHVVLI